MNNQNWSNQYSQTPTTPQTHQGWPNQFGWQRPSTNGILVTGLEEALMKSNERNSDYVYFNQDKPVFYRVKVDMDGRKVWQEFPYNSINQDANLPATKSDFEALNARLNALESALKLESKEHLKEAKDDV